MDLADSQATIAQIETDDFCGDCGFNLHTQRVWRDERLGILVCRCPECGQHHPAGQAVSATRPWLRRLGMGLLIAWLLFVFAFTIAMAMLQFGMLVAHHENFVRYSEFTYEGVPVQAQFDSAGNAVVFVNGVAASATNTRMWVVPPGAYGTNDIWTNEGAWILTVLLLVYVAAVVAQGGLLALALWHRHRIWPWASGVTVLLLTAGLFLTMVHLDDYMRFTSGWMTRWALTYVGLGVVALTLTVRFARPIARGVLTLFFPIQSRRTFSFLWIADGKPLP